MVFSADKKIRHVEIVLLVIVVIWGINTPVMKIGLSAVPPLVYNAFRLVIAAALSLAALMLAGTYRPMPAKDIKRIAVISIAGFFFNQIFITYGMSLTTAGNTAIVLATLPVEVAIINRMLRIEHISRQVAMGIVASLLGVLIIVLGSGKELSLSGPHIVGTVLVLIGQFCYGYYTVRFKELVNDYSIYQIMASVLTITAALFCLVALPDLARTEWQSIPSAAWYSIIFSAVFALSAANIVWIWAVGLLGSTKASLYPNLCPVFAIAFAWVYLDETFGLLQAAGAAITFLGLYLTRNQPAQPASGEMAGRTDL